MEQFRSNLDLLCDEKMPLIRTWTSQDTEKFLRDLDGPLSIEMLAAMTVKACKCNAYVNGDQYGYMTVENPMHRDAILHLLRGLNFSVDIYEEGRELSIGINFGIPDEEEQPTPASTPVIGAKRGRDGSDEDGEADDDDEIVKSFKDSDDESTVVCESQE